MDKEREGKVGDGEKEKDAHINTHTHTEVCNHSHYIRPQSGWMFSLFKISHVCIDGTNPQRSVVFSKAQILVVNCIAGA